MWLAPSWGPAPPTPGSPRRESMSPLARPARPAQRLGPGRSDVRGRPPKEGLPGAISRRPRLVEGGCRTTLDDPPRVAEAPSPKLVSAAPQANGRRSPLQSSRPNLDVPRSNLDVPRSNLEAPRSTLASSRPQAAPFSPQQAPCRRGAIWLL